MKRFPKQLTEKLAQRVQNSSLRSLPHGNTLVDFSSNDYLGLARNESLFDTIHGYLIERKIKSNGATGSRLLTGNHSLYIETESRIAAFHESESALLFNSGYDANVGFFSAVPQRNDVILYDELSHASIRDGIQMSHAKAYKFPHNDAEALEKLLQKFTITASTVYIVTESVFSMDGDTPPMESLALLSQEYGAYLVVDEAHALGVFGEKGEGIVQQLGLTSQVFARIITFGKGLGCHGAAVVSSSELTTYLVNFARSFIYTTGLSPHAVATIYKVYELLMAQQTEQHSLKENITHFNQTKKQLGLQPLFVYSKSAIQCAIISGNQRVKQLAEQLQHHGFDVKPILSPTVPEGQERLRFCIHSYNSKQEIDNVLQLLSTFVF
jgi:8-amino-7-oxononanoate synthase